MVSFLLYNILLIPIKEEASYEVLYVRPSFGSFEHFKVRA